MNSIFFPILLLLLYSSPYSLAQSGTCSTPAGIPQSAPECAKKCARIKVQEGYCSDEAIFNDAYQRCMSDNCNAQDKSNGLKYSYNDICPAACKGTAPPTSTGSANPPVPSKSCGSPAGVPDSAPACVKKCASIKVKEGYCYSESVFNDALKQCLSDNCNAQDKATGLTYAYKDICPADCRGDPPPTSTASTNPPVPTRSCDSPAGVPDSAPACVKKCARIKVKEGYCYNESIFNDALKQCLSDNCNAQDKATGLTYSYKDICPADCRDPPPTSTASSNRPAPTGSCDSPAGVPDSAPACVKKCASIKVKEGYCYSESIFNDALKQCLSDNCNAQDKATGLTYSYNDICPAKCKGVPSKSCDSPAGVPDSAPACVKKCASIKVKEGYCYSESVFNDALKQCLSDNCNAQDKATGLTYAYKDICPVDCRGGPPPTSTASTNPPVPTRSCDSPAGVPDSAPACVKKCASIKVKEGYCYSESIFNDALKQCLSDNCNAQDKATGLTYSYNNICPANCKGDAPPTSTASSNPPAPTGSCNSPAGVPDSAPACVKKCASIKVKEGYCYSESIFNDALKQCLSDNCNAQDKATGLTYSYKDICPADCKGDAPPTSTASSNPPAPTGSCGSPAGVPDSAPACVKKCASIKVKEGYCYSESIFNDALQRCLSDNCNAQDKATGLTYSYNDICPADCKGDAPPTSTTSSNPPAPTGSCDAPAGLPDSAPACVKKCASIKVKEGYCSSEPTFNDAYSQCMSDNCNAQDKSTGLTYKHGDICPADCKSDPVPSSSSAAPTSTASSNPDPTSTASSDPPAPTGSSADPTSTASSDPGLTSTASSDPPAPTGSSADPTSTASSDPGPTSTASSDPPAPTGSSANPTSTASSDPDPTSTASSDPPAPTGSSVDPTSTASSDPGVTSTASSDPPAPTGSSADPTPTASSDPGLTSTASSDPPAPTGSSADPTSTASSDPGLTSTASSDPPAPTRSSANPTSTASSDPGPTSTASSDPPAPTGSSVDPTSTASSDPAPTSTASSDPPAPTGTCETPAGVPDSAPKCVKRCAEIKVQEGYCSNENTFNSAYSQCMSDNCNAQDKSTGLKYTYTDICLPDCKDDPSPQTTSAAPITSTLPTTSAPPTSTTSSSSPPTSTVSADPEVPTRTCEKPALTPNKAPECAKKCARRTVQEGYCETESLFDQAYKQCLDNNCNPQDTKAALQFKYDDICPATCRSDPGTSTTSTAPTPMTSSDPNPTATTSSSLPVSTTACDPSSLVPARAPACVKKCAKIKVQEGYCTDERVFNKAYKQCLSDNCNGQDASTGLQYKFDNLCPAACRSDPSATSTSSPPTSTVSSDSPSPTTVCVAKIPDGSPACVNKCATIKVQEGYCSNQAVFNKAYAQCIRDNCEETDTDKGLEYKWDDICPIECTSTPPSSGVNPSPTGITSSGSNGTPSATSNSPVPTASNSDAGISPTSSSAGPSPTGDAGSGSGGLPPSTPPCARKCARIKVQEGYCYSSDVLMTAFYQCLSDNCAPNDAAKGRTLTYRQICGSAGISPTSSSPGPSPTGDAGSGSGNLPASTPQCARKCASFKVSEGYCSSSNVLMAALFKCLSDNCNPSDAALGRQLTYRQICGSTGPSSSSSSPGPSPTGDGGSSLGGLPSNTPPCVRKCATIKVREGYCSSSQIFMTAFFQCLSDNCNFNDVAKGRQLTHRQICGSTGPNPSTASAGPLPTGGTGSGTSGLPASAPSCVRKCATIKVREGYCYSSQIMMTAFFQCLSDNCNSNDAAKGRQFIYFQICGPTGPNPSTSSAGPSPTGGTGSGPAGLPATTPSCVRKCASIKVREGYCYSSQVFMAAFFQCLSDNCNSNDAATGRRLTYLQLCSVTGPNPPSSPAGPLPTGGTGSGTGGLPANTPSCASRCASIKVREGYCYSSQIMMTAFFQCLSDNCNSIDAAKGRQLTYRQICGSTGPNPSSPSAGPSPTGGAGSNTGGLPAATPSCARKCATIKVTEGYCFSSQIFTTAFFRCLSDNCNSIDAAKGRQLTYSQICGSTDPNPSSSSAGPSPTGGAGAGTGGLPPATPSCARKCAAIKVTEGYCSSSQIFMTAFFQCLSDNCKSEDAAKGRSITYIQICGSLGGGGGTPITSSTAPIPTGNPGPGSTALNNAPACVKKCARVKVSEGYCYSAEAFTISYHRCLRDNCDRDGVREGLRIGSREICPSSSTGSPTDSSASTRPTNVPTDSNAALNKAPDCVKTCARVKVSEGYCYSAEAFTVSYHRCLRDNCNRDAVREGQRLGYNEICPSRNPDRPLQPPESGSSNTTNPGASSGQIPSTAPRCVRNCAQTKIREGYCTSPIIFSSSYLRCLTDNCNSQNLAIGRQFTYVQICGSSGNTGSVVQPGNPPPITSPTDPTGNKTGTGHVPSTAPRCVMNCARIKVQEGYCASPVTFTKAFSQCLRTNCNQADADAGAKLTHKQICGPNDASESGKPPCDCGRNSSSPSNPTTVERRSVRHAPRQFVL